jgi:hypothetical protein
MSEAPRFCHVLTQADEPDNEAVVEIDVGDVGSGCHYLGMLARRVSSRDSPKGFRNHRDASIEQREPREDCLRAVSNLLTLTQP